MSLPCQPYITEVDLADCGMCAVGSLSENQVQSIIQVASEVLYLKTGQQFPGQCMDTVRPCSGCSTWNLPYPVRFASGWRNVCGCSDGRCGAGGATILLPKRPVISIASITIDGAAFADYRLDSPGWIVRTDGGDWPSCQDITLDSGEAGTWEVSYLYGKVAPQAVIFAATVLSSELVKACQGDDSCRIPAGAVSVARRGVTYDIDLTGGRTGLYEVDMVIDSFNPEHRKRRARVYAPDDDDWVRSTTGS